MAFVIFVQTFHSFGLSILRRFHKESNLMKDFMVVDQRCEDHNLPAGEVTNGLDAQEAQKGVWVQRST